MTCKDCVHYDACEEMYEAYKQDSIDWDRGFDDCGFSSCCNHFKNKADFVEVKHGRWTNTDECEYMCTNCNEYFCIDIDMHPIDDCNMFYCPNCGADMRKEGADNG